MTAVAPLTWEPSVLPPSLLNMSQATESRARRLAALGATCTVWVFPDGKPKQEHEMCQIRPLSQVQSFIMV